MQTESAPAHMPKEDGAGLHRLSCFSFQLELEVDLYARQDYRKTVPVEPLVHESSQRTALLPSRVRET